MAFSLNKTCNLENCTLKHEARGFCGAHYLRFKRHGDPQADVPIRDIKYTPRSRADCSVENCNKKSLCKTYCSAHFTRFKTHGNVQADIPLGEMPPHPAWNKGKKGPTGLYAYHWKGGYIPKNRVAEQRKEYEAWRSAVFNRDNYTCQICEQYGGSLHADHLKAWKDYPELRYETNNGRTLCRTCHYYITFKKKMPKGSAWCSGKRWVR